MLRSLDVIRLTRPPSFFSAGVDTRIQRTASNPVREALEPRASISTMSATFMAIQMPRFQSGVVHVLPSKMPPIASQTFF